MRDLPRVFLVHGPTPIVKRKALDDILGIDLWVKRDDFTGGAEAGNKVRKLEYLLGDALARGATTVVTCGAIQSNHARATALACAQLGLRCILFLRVADDSRIDPSAIAHGGDLPMTGNVLLDRLAGAEVRLISRALYAERNAVMEQEAARLRINGARPYVVPEGGSNGLGSLGYVDAMREVRGQLDAGLGGGPSPFDAIVHACGSGGTAAGIALGAADAHVGRRVFSVIVCDDAKYFERVTQRIIAEARAYAPNLNGIAELTFADGAKGPGYAVASTEQRRFIVQVARASGLVLDPVYTGKAMFGLKQAIDGGKLRKGARVLFVHTGGLPGLLADGAAFAAEL